MGEWALAGFDVEEMLGFGATGEVWRARETATGERVALKRLRPGAPPGAVEALRREAAVLQTLDTPYVVRLRAVLGEGAEAVLVLDHAAGGSLAALLTRRGRLEPGEVVTVAAPVAQALAAAHAAGLVHGDVSPANVLFTAEGMPLLSDLGLARVAGERRTELEGTADYADPAVVGGGEPDPASDVWALAAVCHHLLAGSPPYDGATAAEVLATAAAGSRAPLGLLAPRAPRSLVAVVEGALSDAPERRPSAAAFGVALQRAHAAAPVRLTGGAPAAAPGPEPRPTSGLRRAVEPDAPPAAPRRRLPSSRVLVAGGSAAVALVVGLTWALTGGSAAGGALALPAVPVPSGAVPSGALPAVPVPSGALPSGALPSGAAPSAAVPSGAVPSGAAPSRAPVAAPADAEASAEPAGPAAQPDWAVVLDGLDRARERAFARADPALLSAVYVPGAPGRAVDAASLRTLRAAGRTATGVRHEVRRVEPRSVTADRAELQVVDVLAPQVLRDETGREVEPRPGRGELAHDVVLVRVQDGWRIDRLDRA